MLEFGKRDGLWFYRGHVGGRPRYIVSVSLPALARVFFDQARGIG